MEWGRSVGILTDNKKKFTKKLVRILKKHSRNNISIDTETLLFADLSFDSLSYIALLVDIENGFKIEIDEDEFTGHEDIKVKDLLNLIIKSNGG